MSSDAATSMRSIDLHPATHPPADLAKTVYDVVVLGAGPAGRTLAHDTAAAGLSTLLVESELIAGECAYWACVPSKALLRPVEALAEARSVDGARQRIEPDASVDAAAVFARRDAAVRNWTDTAPLADAERRGVAVARGHGRLLGERAVGIQDSHGGAEVRVTATHAVVLATGSRAVMPEIPGLKDVEVWTPREATAANRVPAHLLILGGGVVGCEMATFYAAVGRATLISSGATVLPRMEPEASRRTHEALVEHGVDVHVNTRIERVAPVKGSNDSFEATLSSGQKVTASTLLIAAGRTPNTDGIGLEQLGIADFRKAPVDDQLCAPGTRWLYAVGDANGRSPLTHMGVYQARIAARAIAARAAGEAVNPRPFDALSASADHRMTPQVVVTDPPVGSVGLTLSAARAQGLKVREVSVEYSSVVGAMLHGETRNGGWAQWVVDEERGVLVGASVVGPRAGELLHACTVAVVGEVPVGRLRHAVPSFPTLSEVFTALVVAGRF